MVSSNEKLPNNLQRQRMTLYVLHQLFKLRLDSLDLDWLLGRTTFDRAE